MARVIISIGLGRAERVVLEAPRRGLFPCPTDKVPACRPAAVSGPISHARPQEEGPRMTPMIPNGRRIA
jgi:hypothetical protein